MMFWMPCAVHLGRSRGRLEVLSFEVETTGRPGCRSLRRPRDVVVGVAQHLVEERQAIAGLQPGTSVRALFEGAVLEERREDRVVPSLDRGAFSQRRAIQFGDRWVFRYSPLAFKQSTRLEACNDPVFTGSNET